MSGSKKISELELILNNGLSVEDYFIVNDDSESDPALKTKRIKLSELDSRYLNETDFASDFDQRLLTKTTNDLIEGLNLYYTQARFDSAFDAKSTTHLSEGDNLYYTESRVSSNTEVAANTSKRHDAVTLGSSVGGLSLSGQEVSNQESSASTDGYLSSTNFDYFTKKLDSNIGDVVNGEFNYTITGTPQVITTIDASESSAVEILLANRTDDTTATLMMAKLYAVYDDINETWGITTNQEEKINIGFGNAASKFSLSDAGSGILNVSFNHDSGDALGGFTEGKIRYRIMSLPTNI